MVRIAQRKKELDPKKTAQDSRSTNILVRMYRKVTGSIKD
jgi:hypothetical protein